MNPSIINIKEKVSAVSKFSFLKVNTFDIESEISTFLNIPAKQLKQVVYAIADPVNEIWNNEIITNNKFPIKIKGADITPIFIYNPYIYI